MRYRNQMSRQHASTGHSLMNRHRGPEGTVSVGQDYHPGRRGRRSYSIIRTRAEESQRSELMRRLKQTRSEQHMIKNSTFMLGGIEVGLDFTEWSWRPTRLYAWRWNTARAICLIINLRQFWHRAVIPDKRAKLLTWLKPNNRRRRSGWWRNPRRKLYRLASLPGGTPWECWGVAQLMCPCSLRLPVSWVTGFSCHIVWVYLSLTRQGVQTKCMTVGAEVSSLWLALTTPEWSTTTLVISLFYSFTLHPSIKNVQCRNETDPREVSLNEKSGKQPGPTAASGSSTARGFTDVNIRPTNCEILRYQPGS